METEKASHETEESLILAQLSPAHQTDPLTTKLQNGNHSPGEATPLQLNGDAGWNHFKPGVGVNSMKRHRENCSSPAPAQGLLAQGPHALNGEVKHAGGEQPPLGPHQPKRLRADAAMNGDEDMMAPWKKMEVGSMEGKLEDFPELSKPDDLEGNALQKEPKLDKRNCSFPNGDIFSLSRNKPVLVPNGAMMTPPSVDGSAGDGLEKTLSQYYPQSGSPQADRVDSSLVSELPEQATTSPSLTSGFPISSPEGHNSNGFNNASYKVNGYSGSFAADHQQQQQPQQQPYPSPDLPGLEAHMLSQAGQGPNVAPQSSMGARSQAPNGTMDCFPSNPEGPSIFSKSSQGFSQDSYPLPTVEAGGPPQTEGADLFGAITGLAGSQTNSTPTGQQHLEYGIQQPLNVLCPAESGSLQGPPGSARPTPPPPQQQSMEQHQTGGGRPEPLACPPAQQTRSTELDNELSLPGQTGAMSQRADRCSQIGWIDLNSAGPPPQASASQPQMWKGFPPQAQQGKGFMPSRDNYQTQGFGQPGFPQQDCQTQNTYKQTGHNTAPEWQQSSPEIPPGDQGQPNMQHGKLQHMPQPVNSQFCTPMQQQLCKGDPDLEQILSPDFLPQQQQPVSHSQYEDKQRQRQQQPVCPLQRQPSQDGQSTQPQDPCQRHPLNRQGMDANVHSDSQLASPTYRGPKQAGTQQGRASPFMRANTPYPNVSRPSSQPLPNDMATMFGFSDAEVAGMQENFKVSKAMEMQKQPQQQQQRQYTQSPSAQKQYGQQILNHRMPNRVDLPQQTQPQTQPQLQQGGLGQQTPGQMYLKSESQESCSQFQRGPQPSPGTQGDLQRHAALRMHLLQRQERQSFPQNPNHLRPGLQVIKQENGPRFQAPVPQHPQQLQQQQHVRELPNGMQVMVKQERPSSTSACEQSGQRSILATMEQQLRQYQLSPVFERKSLVIKSPNKVKVEMSGGVTVLSTNADLGGEDQKPLPDFTPTKKEPGLHSFLESPMKLLDTPIKNLLDTPIKTQYDIPPCHCVEQISEKDEGPYYTHLGAAPTLPGIREMMEKRSGLIGNAIRIEKVVYTGKEGKSTQGCPIAKWVIRRASVDEKLLVLVRERVSHSCETACLIVVILIWEGIPTPLADRLYMDLSETLMKHGAHTNRRCALNEERTCACQGLDPEASGASFSFGCSWSMYYNGCKFARSKVPRKFKLLGDDSKEEEKLEQNLQGLATLMGPIYKKMAPDAYANQVEHEHRAPDCRLGQQDGRPFSGVTACMDFCAHAHRDLHNMQGGSTVVCTLTREDNRMIGKIPEDEQLHVLPLYKASATDEFGSAEAQLEKTRTGAIQVLTAFRRQVRMLAEPAKSCRQRKLDAKRAAANKLSHSDTPNSKAEKTPDKLKQSTYENTTQNTPVTGPHSGPMGASLQPGQQPPPLAAHHPPQQQHPQLPNTPHPFTGPLHPPGYSRFPNAPSSFPSTSKSVSMYPQAPAPASPYPSPLHVPTSYMNGSNPPSPYPRSLTPSNLYPSYQCNGGMPIDNYHPYYSPSPKHLDMYRQQRPSLYPEQQYSAHQRYGVNYPPRYGEPSLQVNGYNSCGMRPSVHHMGHYATYGPNGAPDPQFLDTISRSPSAHPSLDYAAMGKGNQFGGYPSHFLSQSPQILPPNLDPLCMQSKPEMNMHGTNGIAQVLPPLGGDCLIPNQSPAFRLPNGNIQATMIKQEPGTPALTPTPKEKEDVWSDNEHNFLDPEIGGVAVAPSHGSILIECAKRELHATTPLKHPNRNHPTRISLVFYQHKNMNEAKHGLALWEAKMAEKAREKEEEAERNGGESTPSKGSSKKVKREHPEPSEPSEPPYKRFIQTLTERSMSCTTNTYVSTAPYAFTKVTGPYNRFL